MVLLLSISAITAANRKPDGPARKAVYTGGSNVSGSFSAPPCTQHTLVITGRIMHCLVQITQR
jgi:hypothetical protein